MTISLLLMKLPLWTTDLGYAIRFSCRNDMKFALLLSTRAINPHPPRRLDTPKVLWKKSELYMLSAQFGRSEGMKLCFSGLSSRKTALIIFLHNIWVEFKILVRLTLHKTDWHTTFVLDLLHFLARSVSQKKLFTNFSLAVASVQ